MTAPIIKKTRIKKKDIPEYLIYEMDEGRPIYYRGYKDVLNDTKTPEQIMGSSSLQSLMVSLMMEFVWKNCGDEFQALSSELGFIFGKKTWRSLDVALYRKTVIAQGGLPFDNHYTKTAPEIVFEIDTKAELSALPDKDEYFIRKTQQLLDAGVQKVIWIFTSSCKQMLAEQGKTWLTDDWGKDITILPGISLNIQQLIAPFENKEM